MSTNETEKVEIIDAQLAISLLPERSADAHKWGVGGLIIVGGSPGYIGAPALAALAAGRSGAGVVCLAIPRSSIGATAALVPEAIFLPLQEGDPITSAQKAFEQLGPLVEKSRAMVVGPGLSRDEHATRLMAAFFSGGRKTLQGSAGFGTLRKEESKAEHTPLLGGVLPTVIDADALHWLATQENWWSLLRPQSVVLTPHVGEFASLRNLESDSVARNPIQAVRMAAEEWQQTVVLKAGKAYISDGERTRTVEISTPALATAGSGDVLAGSIGAFLAQGLSPFDAATLAIFVGNQAALQLTEQYSTLGVVASDLPIAFAQTLATLEAIKGGQQ